MFGCTEHTYAYVPAGSAGTSYVLRRDAREDLALEDLARRRAILVI